MNELDALLSFIPGYSLVMTLGTADPKHFLGAATWIVGERIGWHISDPRPAHRFYPHQRLITGGYLMHNAGLLLPAATFVGLGLSAYLVGKEIAELEPEDPSFDLFQNIGLNIKISAP